MSQLSLACLDQITLSYGSHKIGEARPANPEVTPPQLCAMEAAAWLAGEDHTDRPTCVCEVIGIAVRTLNDRIDDDIRRTQLLKPLIPRLIGTDAFLDVRLARIEFLVKYIVTIDIPRWIALSGEPFATHVQQFAEHYPNANKWTDLSLIQHESDVIRQLRYSEMLSRLERLMQEPVHTARLTSALYLSEYAEAIFNQYSKQPADSSVECYKGLAEAISCMVDIHE